MGARADMVESIAGVSVMSCSSSSSLVRERMGTRPFGLRCRYEGGNPFFAPRSVVVKGRADSERAMWEAREQEPGVM